MIPYALFSNVFVQQSCVFNDTILAAVWSELGRVSIWDLKSHLTAVENRTTVNVRSVKKKNKKPVTKSEETQKPLFTFTGHLQEGFAIDWSSTTPGTVFPLFLKFNYFNLLTIFDEFKVF